MNKFKHINKFVTLITTFVVLLSAAIFPLQTLALSSAQRSIFDRGILYFNTDGVPSDTTVTTCTPGNMGSNGPPATPGSGAPDGAAFPNLDPNAMANAINTWISQENPNSKLAGLGSTIVEDGKNSNVNPFLMVAIAKEESSLSDPGDYNVSHGSNSFGRAAADGQPSFQGARAWYYWSTVEASVDYTAPENQGVSGGGDMGTYLRSEYSDQLDANNLVAMFLRYAPPGDNNNTAQYISNVQSWINTLVNLSNGTPSTTSDTNNDTTSNTADTNASTCIGTTTTCTVGSGTATGPNAAILCEAEKYAGIYYELGGGHSSYSTFREQCPENAIASAAASSTADSPGPCATDCSGLVSVAVDAAYNQAFVWTVSDADGTMQGGGAQYWQKVPIAQAAAGDIVTTDSPDGHVEIVDHVSGGTIYTFGSHHTGAQTGPISLSTDYWLTGAWRWTGPGSSTQ